MTRRASLVAAGTLILAAALAVAVTVLFGGDDGSSPAASSNPHSGMVSGTVWIANEESGSLTAIDAARNEVVANLSGIEGPHNLQASPDGKSLWAVSGHDSLAVMVATDRLTLHGTVKTGREPAHIVLAPDNRKAYTTNGADGTVTAIDVASMRQVATIPVGASPHGLRPSPDGQWVYVANAKGTTVSVIDAEANTRVADIEVGDAPVQVAFAPDGRNVYASLNGEDAVAKIDVERRLVVGKVRVGVGPIQVYVSPDGRYLLVANQGTEERPSTTVSVVDTATFKVVKTVATGLGAHGVVIDPSSSHAYVTNIYGDDVAVLDLSQLEIVARIPVGKSPNGISFSDAPPPAPRSDKRLEIPMQHEESAGGMEGMDME